VPAPAAAAAPSAAPAGETAALRDALQQELGDDIVLGEEISRGPLTVSFRAVEKQSNRSVCVQVVPPRLADIERGVVDRLLRTARTASRLKHPRILPVLRVAAGDRLCWYVTRHDESETLEQLLEREYQLPVERVVSIAGHIATALSSAHDSNLPHGALTPASVLVGEGDAVCVRDFGISRASRTGLGQHGLDDGAYHYLAPEVDAAAHPLAAAGIEGLAAPSDPAADQYALAVIVYLMLTGNLPFFGQSPEDIRREHRTSQVPPLSASRPELPAALSTVLERGMAKNPADRFPSVVRFAAALRQATQGRTSPSRAVSGRTSDTLYFPEAERARPVTVKHALIACVATLALILAAWRSSSAAWDTTAGSGRLVAPRPAGEQSVATGRSSLGGSAAVPDERRAPLDTGVVPPPAAGGNQPNRRVLPEERSRNERAANRRGDASDDNTMGFVTVGTNPQSTIYINNLASPTNPVRNWTTTAGRVFLRFEVTDSSGCVHSQEMTVNLAAGDTLNLGRIRLGTP
jgi:serine/threonine-protein kinase